MMFALFAAAVVACLLFSVFYNINYHQLIETAAEAKQTHTHTEKTRERESRGESDRGEG